MHVSCERSLLGSLNVLMSIRIGIYEASTYGSVLLAWLAATVPLVVCEIIKHHVKTH